MTNLRTSRRTDRQTQRLTIATLASGAPMGQQVYEEEIAARAADAVGTDFAIARTIVRSLRSPLPGTARLPAHLMGPASERTRLLAGRWLYRGSDVVHRMSLSLPPAPGPEILTIHDTVAWRFPDESTPEPHAASESRRAAAVVSPSNFSADDAAEHLGIDRPVVIHNGVDERFFDAAPLGAAELEALGIDGPFVLHAGGASARKNLEGLAGAWPLVHKARPDVVLVLSGPQHPRRDALFSTLDGTRLVGRVANASVPGLIAAASCVVVPSLYEGFGLPALEGMASGVPVVAANRSSLPEVCGSHGILVEPTPGEIAEGILLALDGGPEIDAMVAGGLEWAGTFTWERSAREHAAVWRSVAG